LSLAIGRRGQNVRLASKLVGWDIEIMTHDELNEGIERAEGWFSQVPHVTSEMVEAFIEEGFLSYDDLTFLEPAELAELSGVTEEQAEDMIAYSEEASERVEEEQRIAKEQAERERALAPPPTPAPTPAERAAQLFSDEPVAPVVEDAKPTLESLFGPETAEAPAEEAATNGAEAPTNAAEAAPEETVAAPAETETPPPDEPSVAG
jgi:N utilization substance protein A